MIYCDLMASAEIPAHYQMLRSCREVLPTMNGLRFMVPVGQYSIHSVHFGLDELRFRFTMRSWSTPLIDNFIVSWAKGDEEIFIQP